jgi:hypothetical protein
MTHTAYRTPFGTFDTWEGAAVACEKRDMDPVTCIKIEVSPTDVQLETAYGKTARLPFVVRCF